MNLPDYYGLGSQGLLLAAFCQMLLRQPGRMAAHALPVALGLGIWALLPWGMLWDSQGGSPARWLRGVLGDPSLLLAQLAAVELLRSRFPRLTLPARSQSLLAWTVCAIGIPLLVIALGGGQSLFAHLGLPGFDPYAWGYHPQGLLGVLAGIAVLLHVTRHAGLLLLLGVCGGAYALHLSDSDNLWDYLLDPLLCGIMLFRCGRQWFRRDCLSS